MRYHRVGVEAYQIRWSLRSLIVCTLAVRTPHRIMTASFVEVRSVVRVLLIIWTTLYRLGDRLTLIIRRVTSRCLIEMIWPTVNIFNRELLLFGVLKVLQVERFLLLWRWTGDCSKFDIVCLVHAQLFWLIDLLMIIIVLLMVLISMHVHLWRRVVLFHCFDHFVLNLRVLGSCSQLFDRVISRFE